MEVLEMDFKRGVRSVERPLFERPGSDIRHYGILKKLKTMKKKYFVLRSTSSSGPARLEYYDSEKKFHSGHLPKRSIHLHTCFNINRKSDSRHKYAIALYTKEECFSVICDNEERLNEWLNKLLEYQNEYVHDGGREHYDHVWQVTLQCKGLGQSKLMRGPYRLCLTQNEICLVKLDSDKPQYTFQLETVRSLARTDNIFRMEVGKIAPTGEGELYMLVDDAVTAQNLHEIILSYMKNRTTDTSTLPRSSKIRPRTSSESTQLSGRTRQKDQRPASVYASNSRSAGQLECTMSPNGGSYCFGDQSVNGGHRQRSGSNDSKTSHSSTREEMPLSEFEEEQNENEALIQDLSAPSSPGTQEILAPYMSMGSAWTASSAPISIHQNVVSSSYFDMSPHSNTHSILPPVKESGSSEGYLPMSPCGTSPGGSSSGRLQLERVPCLLSDDSSDFAQPPTRTYSLGSRPLKTPVKYTGYMEMSGSKGVADNGRSCSAPHLITHHNYPGRTSAGNMRSGNIDSPTPSASPLSMSLKSDDSDSFMELDFYRPRTASDSYSYRPRASSFGVQQNLHAQGHRPRSSSHGQGTRPARRHKITGVDSGRTSHEMLHHLSQNSSTQSSFDSLQISSSESLRRLSLKVQAKTSQLNNVEYMDMSFEKRQTPSPQPGNKPYVNMTLGNRKSSPGREKSSSRSNSKTNSSEKLQDSDYTNMTFGGGVQADISCHREQQLPSNSDSSGKCSTYMKMDNLEVGSRKHDSPLRSSPIDNTDSYITYEPASVRGTGISGHDESFEKVDISSEQRCRSGSLGKDSVKRGIFSLMHSDSSKSNSRKSESQTQSGFGVFGGGPGERHYSLGHDIRKKSSLIPKSAGRQSASFSQSLDSSHTPNIIPSRTTKRSTPPPKEIDSNDEYIEFSPITVKSDSDSSHSSGSAHAAARSCENAGFTKREADYVGFEPGSITTSVKGCAASGPGQVSSSYVQMGDKLGSGSSAAAFKSVPASSKPCSAKRSDSKDGTKRNNPLSSPAVALPRGATMLCSQDHSIHSPSPTQTNQRLQQEISAAEAPKMSLSLTADSKLIQASGAAAQQKSSVSPFSVLILPSDESGSSKVLSPPSPGSSPASITSLSKVREADYVSFNPQQPSAPKIMCLIPDTVTKPANARVVRPTEVPFSLASTISASSPSMVTVVSPTFSGTLGGSMTTAQDAGCSSLSVKDKEAVEESVSHISNQGNAGANCLSQTKTRRVSGSKAPSITNSTGSLSKKMGVKSEQRSSEQIPSPSVSGVNDSFSVQPVSGKLQSGNGIVKLMGTKDLKQESSSSPSGSSVSLTRPDSTPCMLNMGTSGTGRGRHCSSSSQGGSSEGNNSGFQTSTTQPARHSITDLSGYEQMSFSSNTLSQQQSQNQQSQQQLCSQQTCGSAVSSQNPLNYATLDLGSAESIGDSGDSNRSPRNKSRHPSSADEKCEAMPYATIVFDKSESLKNTNEKDVNFTL